MSVDQARLHPIIYVRGYAMTQGEIDETTADPYNGFNVGSTKLRQLWNGDCTRHYFESPLIRLMKDYEYRDVYVAGEEMPLNREIDRRSIFVYRYYDALSSDFGTGAKHNIEEFAIGLGQLIDKVRGRICGEDQAARDAFRVYLVAHSMGGLVCRCFLQNQNLGAAAKDVQAMLKSARSAVEKVFTYATPHNGIDVRGIGNVPAVFAAEFNRPRMKTYLNITSAEPDGRDQGDVDSLDGHFDPSKFFCLVGTDDRDYGVAAGAARFGVGPMSDGLVRIANATVWGPDPQRPGKRLHAPRAFVHRSHSGHYGIVNSEDGYQNLIRFLFGDVRVDGTLEIEDLYLPKEVQKQHDAAKAKEEEGVRASYHFEVVVRTRNSKWDVHRRTVAENSAIFRQYDELKPKPLADGSVPTPRHPHLFSAFLATKFKARKQLKGLAFSIDLGIQVPQYTINRKFWIDSHHEGGYLYRDKINIIAIPPADEKGGWQVKYGFDRKTPNQVSKTADSINDGQSMMFTIPIEQNSKPGIRAKLVLRASAWK